MSAVLTDCQINVIDLHASVNLNESIFLKLIAELLNKANN